MRFYRVDFLLWGRRHFGNKDAAIRFAKKTRERTGLTVEVWKHETWNDRLTMLNALNAASKLRPGEKAGYPGIQSLVVEFAGVDQRDRTTL